MRLEFATATRSAKASVAPKNITTGTSYTAKGMATPPKGATVESGSGRPVVIPELVPELASAYQRQIVYTQMMNDATCDVSMRAVKTPVLGAEFYIDPYSNDQMDIDVGDFICDNLFGGMDDPLLVALHHILSFCEDGYSVVQPVFENREWAPDGAGRNTKTYTMLKTLAPRPTNTMGLVSYDDNGHFTNVVQNAIKADNSVDQVTLNAQDLLVFTLNAKGTDITGKSLLRTAYPHWYYKTHMYKLDAIQKERHAIGVPRGKLLPGYTEADLLALRTLLKNIRANEESYIIETPNVAIDFAEVHSNLVDVLKSADHHSMMIMLNVLAGFLALGITEGASGGRATGATQSDMFMKSLRYIANLICDVINMNLIPQLVVWNFPTRNFPKLCVRNIGETQDLQKLASAYANLFAQSAITGDIDTENFIRRIFDMPAKKAGAAAQPPTKETIDVKGDDASQDIDDQNAEESGTQKGNVTVARQDAGGGNNGAPASGNY